MRKYKEVGRRILGMVLAVCMVIGLIPPLPAQAATSIAAATVTLYKDADLREAVQDTTYTYTGTVIKPYVKVTDPTTQTVLVEGTDYVIMDPADNVNAGTGTVTICGIGNYSGETTAEFKINPVKIDSIRATWELSDSDGMPYCYYTSSAGGAKPNITTVTATALDGSTPALQPEDYTITYGNNTTVCTDMENASAKPYFTIALRSGSNYTYAPGTSARTYNYRIYYNMDNVVVNNGTSMTFNGTAQEPAFTLTNVDVQEPVTVPQSGNYEYWWTDNTDAGEATLSIRGVGSYKGTKTVKYTIGTKNIADSDVTITMDADSYEYTGDKIPMEDHVIVTLSNGYVVPNTNYDITYTTSTAGMGNNLLTLTGKNNMTGKKTVSYRVTSILASCATAQSEYVYTGQPVEPLLSVKNRLGEVVASSSYSVTYYTDETYTTALTGQQPTAVGTYYIQVTANADTNYSGTVGTAESPISFKIIPRSFESAVFKLGDNIVNSESQTGGYYNGKSVLSTLEKLSVTDDGRTLEKGTEYTVAYYSDKACTEEIEAVSDNFKAVGIYYIKITGKAAYDSSEYVISYEIKPVIVVPTITVKEQSYTGQAVIPAKEDVTVKATINGSEQTITDFEIIQCLNNVNIGTAKIVIQLTGNYTTATKITIGTTQYEGAAEGNFVIAPKKISDCDSKYDETAVYNGETQKPGIVIKDGSRTLTEGVDYNVKLYTTNTYESKYEVAGIRNVGKAYVVVSGIGAYANTAQDANLYFTYTITAKPLTDTDVTFSAANSPYTGEPVTPALTVKDGETLLTAGRDYSQISYYTDEACTVVSTHISGKVYVKISGMGNYSGSIVAVCYIGDDISETADALALNGDAPVYDMQSHYDELNTKITLYDTAGEIISKDKYTIHYYADSNYKNEITNKDNELFIKSGTIYVRIEGTNKYYGTFDGSVAILPRSIAGMDAVVLQDYTYTGDAIALTINDGTDLTKADGVQLSYPATTGISYILTSDDYEIRANSYVNNRNAGTATVTLVGKGNYTGTRAVNFVIRPKSLNDLDNLKVTIPRATYTSRKQEPSVTVTYGDRNLPLSAGTDFELEYYTNESYSSPASDADLVNAGTIYVKITGRGNYSEVVSKDKLSGSNVYVIEPRDINETNVSIEGLSFIYSAIQTPSKIPSYNVRYQYVAGSYYTLTQGIDYTCKQETAGVGYTIGSQEIDITGSGNFTGIKTVRYYYLGNMDNAADEVTVEGIAESYSYAADTATNGITCPNIVVRTSAGQVLDSSCYKISYDNNKAAGTATVKISGNNSQYWTGTYQKNFKITGSIADAEILIPDQIYTGKAYTKDTLQNIQVICDGMTLTYDVDYKITDVKNATNAALATSGATAPSITIQGIGDYFAGTATKTQTFSIKYDITSENLVVSKIENQVFTGSEVTPAVTVEYVINPVTGASVSLKEGVDYELTYRNNTAVGAANGANGPHIVITAKDEGVLTSGYIIAPFTIGQVNLEDEAGGYHITGIEEQYYYTGREIKPAVTVEDADGNVLDPKNYNVTYRMSTAKPEAGTVVTITVVGRGNYYGTLTTSFKIAKRNIATAQDNVSAVIEDQTYSGAAIQPAFKVTFEDYAGETQTLREGVDYTIVGYYNNKNAAQAGSKTYGVNGYEDGPYVQIKAIPGTSMEGTRNIPFTILPKDVSELYYGQIENPVYETGQSVYNPELTVKLLQTSTEPLVQGVDYKLTYVNNTEAAEANGANGPHILIEPSMNNTNLTGSYMIEYSILPKDITGESFEVLLSDDDLMNHFDAEKWNYPDMGTYYPNVELRDNLESGKYQKLSQDTDYSITYEDNGKVGTASVILTAKGNYTGVKTVNFTIGTLFDFEHITVCVNNSAVLEIPSVVYNGENQLPEGLTVKTNDTAELLTEGTDYEVSYYLDEDCKYAVMSENVIDAKTYYVQVKGLTTAGYIGSVVLPYTITQKNLNLESIVAEAIPDQKFAGGNVRPSVTLRDRETGLVIPPASYDVTYRNNNSIGTAYAVVTANENSNYTGEREISFRIVEQEIGSATVYDVPDCLYTGKEVRPTPTVYYNGTKLAEGTDYTLTYGNNIYAGKAWIIIQGKGNYKETKQIFFNIRASLEDAVVSAISNQAYTGKAVTPGVTVSCGGNKLKEGVDYTLSYTNNVAVGDAAVIISPSESNPYYVGSRIVEFAICNSVAAATITGVPSSQTYTGSLITPEPQVYIGGKKLVKGRDYTVKWQNEVNVGTAAIEIVGTGENGTGEYVGRKVITYKIIPKSIARCKANKLADISYNKASHTPKVVVQDGKKILAEGTDYTVSYKKNTSIGTGVAVIKGIGNYSGSIKNTFHIVSAPITGLKATAVNTSTVKLSWTKKSNITGYQVYTKNSRKRIVQTKKNSLTVKNLKAGKSYTYKVRTYTKIGKKTYYGDFKTITFAAAPQAPTIAAVSNAKKTAVISWNRVSGAKGYDIYVSTKANGTYKKAAMVLKGNVVSYTHKKLKSGTTYYYKVRAYRKVKGKKVYSAYSNVGAVKVR